MDESENEPDPGSMEETSTLEEEEVPLPQENTLGTQEENISDASSLEESEAATQEAL